MKAVVVGGGLLGLLTARALRQFGATVTVVEQGDFGQESSWAGGGILSPLYPWDYSNAVNDLAALSQSGYRSLIQQLIDDGGIDPQWTQNGMLVLDPDHFSTAREWAAQRDIACREWDARSLHEQEPEIGGEHQGILLPNVAQVRNPRLLKSVLHSVRSLGVTLVARNPVIELTHQAGQTSGVRTLKAHYVADVVVVCAGAWTARILSRLGLTVDIKPVRGQMIMYRSVPGLIKRITLFDHHYIIPRRDGRVLVGSTLEDTDFDKSTTQQAYLDLCDYAETLYPCLKQAQVERHWAGLRPASPDGIPYICPVPEFEGLFLNAGHFRNGVVLAPASVQLLMDLISKRSPRLNPDPYQLNRL